MALPPQRPIVVGSAILAVVVLGIPVGGFFAAGLPLERPASAGSARGSDAPVATASDVAVSFVERGLPSGTNWGVSLSSGSGNGSGGSSFSKSNTTTVSFTVTAGAYRFLIPNASAPGFLFLPSPSNGSIVLNGSSSTVNVTFEPLALYPLRFVERGLANGTYWEVRITDASVGTYNGQSVSTTLTLEAPAGVYEFTVSSSPPYGTFYSVTPAQGSVILSAPGASVNVTFVRENAYTVSFVESGLPSGTDWFAGVNWANGGEGEDTVAPTISFPLSNGTYLYVVPNTSIGSILYVSTPSQGKVVIDGAPVTIDVSFVFVPTFSVTFVETGLPVGTSWYTIVSSPALGNVSYTSDQVGDNATTDLLPAGVYGYTIVGPAGYQVEGGASPVGNLTLTDANVTEPVEFVAGPTYTVSFHEAGLPTGTSWCVSLGWRACGTTSSLAFTNLTPWHFSYRVGGTPGYAASVATATGHPRESSSGMVNVTTHAVRVKVRFVPLTYGVTFQESGLGAGTGWSVRIEGAGHGRPAVEKHGSRGSTITFLLPNGTYTFAALPVRGYSGGESGTIAVNGSAVTVTVTFVKVSGPG